jgi:hypothetical protein
MDSWRKSSYSGSSGGDCVEAAGTPGVVLVRDTANRSGAVLSVSDDAWKTFTDGLK